MSALKNREVLMTDGDGSSDLRFDSPFFRVWVRENTAPGTEWTA